MNARGMKAEKLYSIPLLFVPLPIPLDGLDCGSAARVLSRQFRFGVRIEYMIVVWL